MSREILTQEEIDALLEGLDQGEENKPVETEDLTDRVVEKTAELVESGGVPAELERWDKSFVPGSTVVDEQPPLWGEIEVSDPETMGAHYYVDRRSLQAIREISGAAGMENPAGLLEDVVAAFCEALTLQLAQDHGQAVDAEPGRVRTGNIEDSIGSDGSWFRVRLWMRSGEDAPWVLNLVLPEDLMGALGVDAQSSRGGHGAEEAPVHVEQGMSTPSRRGGESARGGPRIQRAEFGQLRTGRDSAPPESRIEMLMDVPLEVSVELGRTVCHIREVLSLGTGSILEMEKQAGEAVEVLVNGKLVAHGEVVVVDENFAVRITEIVSVRDRLEKLR